MATLRQKKLAKALIENAISKKPKNKLQLVASVGYSAQSAEKKATEIIESKGTQQELTDLGFTEENAKAVIVGILKAPTVFEMVTPTDKLRAAQEVFKVFGTYAAEKTFNLTATASVDELKSIIQQDLAKFRPQQ